MESKKQDKMHKIQGFLYAVLEDSDRLERIETDDNERFRAQGRKQVAEHVLELLADTEE